MTISDATPERSRILLLESETNIRRFVAANLRARGYDVIETADAEEALRLMRQQVPDLFVANLRLPGHSVWPLLEQMAGDDDLSVIPVLAMTPHQIITVRPRDRWDLLNALRDFRWNPED